MNKRSSNDLLITVKLRINVCTDAVFRKHSITFKLRKLYFV